MPSLVESHASPPESEIPESWRGRPPVAGGRFRILWSESWKSDSSTRKGEGALQTYTKQLIQNLAAARALVPPDGYDRSELPNDIMERAQLGGQPPGRCGA